MKLLHIDSSIRGKHSISRKLSAAIVEQFKSANPKIEITYRDLAEAPPPYMTFASLPGDHPSSAFAGPLGPDAQRTRGQSQTILDEFMEADIVVLGVPMYNWSIPSQLKSWIDLIVVPNKTFSYGGDGPIEGLVGNKRVIIALSRGVFYRPGTPEMSAEHAENYLRTVLAFIGVTRPEFVITEGVTVSEQMKARALESALHAIQELAA